MRFLFFQTKLGLILTTGITTKIVRFSIFELFPSDNQLVAFMLRAIIKHSLPPAQPRLNPALSSSRHACF